MTRFAEVIAVDERSRQVVDALAAWVDGEAPPHRSLSGPSGSGRTYIASAVVAESGGLSFPAGGDWRVPMAALRESQNRLVVIDDVHSFDASFAQELCSVLKAGNHRVLVTRPLAAATDRVVRLLLRDPGSGLLSLELTGWDERALDIRELARHSAKLRGVELVDPNLAEIVGVIQNLPFPDGRHEISRFLDELMSAGVASVSPTDITAAYSRALRAGRVTPLPVILVEDKTDEVYLTWAKLAAGRTEQIRIEPCGAATGIPRRAAALTNSGIACVALFDFDDVGSDQHKQLKAWKYPSMTLPRESFQLGEGTQDHVRCIVEIEDMLPVGVLRQFFAAHRNRMPELVITIPRSGRERLVVGKDDKLALAEWVAATQTTASAKGLIDVYDRLIASLNGGAVGGR